MPAYACNGNATLEVVIRGNSASELICSIKANPRRWFCGLILGEYHKGLRSNVHFLSCEFIVLQPNNHIFIIGINNILQAAGQVQKSS